MIDTLKTKAANVLLKKRLSKSTRKVYAKGFKEAKKVGILYHYEPKIEKVVRSFAHFLKEERMQVDTLGYISNKDYYDTVQPELTYNYFHKKHLNWLHIPTEKQCLELMYKEYDILFDLTIQSYFPLKYIISLSKAHFKVGASIAYRNEVCDLTIDIAKQKELNYLINQLKHYLKLIN